MPLFSSSKTNVEVKSNDIDIQINSDKYDYGPMDDIAYNSTYIVPSGVVSILNRISRFLISKWYKMDKKDVKFILGEFHIVSFLSLSGSLYWALINRRKYKKIEKLLHEKLEMMKYNNLYEIANLDKNNIKRTEITYLKQEIDNYNQDMLIRMEFRTYFEQTMQCLHNLTNLQIKILSAVNEYIRGTQNILLKYNKNDNKKLILKKIQENFDKTELAVDKYETWFDDQQNPENILTKRENEKKLMSDEIRKRDEADKSEDMYDHIKLYDENVYRSSINELPIFLMDFEAMSKHQLDKIVDAWKYDEIMQINSAKRQKLISNVLYGSIGLLLFYAGYKYKNRIKAKSIQQTIDQINNAI